MSSLRRRHVAPHTKDIIGNHNGCIRTQFVVAHSLALLNQGTMDLKYFDAHCHIKHVNQSVSGIGAITNAARYSDWPDIVSVSKSSGDIYGAIGLHPWYLIDVPTNWDTVLKELLIADPALMVGEIGVDKYKPDLETQIDFFERQFNIASNLRRGVIIHCVGMWQYMTNFLDKYSGEMPPFILFHRYSGTAANITMLAGKYNAFFSYSNPDDRRILSTPPERILSESDTADLNNIMAIANKMACAFGTETATFVNNAQRMLRND